MVKVEVKNVVKEDEPNVERKEHGKDGEKRLGKRKNGFDGEKIESIYLNSMMVQVSFY